MRPETEALLKAFEALQPEERLRFADEILRRSLPFDSGPLAGDEIGAAAFDTFRILGDDEAVNSR